MGHITNREEKKKAARVFSCASFSADFSTAKPFSCCMIEWRGSHPLILRSGGGGGTKGPAVVDKRNVELDCPHCDRTFKQVVYVQR